ncbi:MAG: GIY-YIG nuclease family protein, partial [Candidatus Hydrogenedentes bacterium]|nr:GIY-YIG nuclease family protein [Candidatus Hydrogenedentota bacterium]
MKTYAVYILANRSRTLYTGMTGDLQQRVEQHKSKEIEGFTKRYAIDQLVFYELHDTAAEAIAREKQIKGWTRAKKTALIEENNPVW